MLDETPVDEPFDEPFASNEHARMLSIPHLNGLHVLHAHFVTYAFKRHVHDYFAIGIVVAGLQQFDYHRDHFVTPPKGIIVINPGEPHTGGAAVPQGFHYRALYPDAETMRQIAHDIGRWAADVPMFSQPVIHDDALFEAFQALHAAFESTSTTLEHESRWSLALGQLIARHADPPAELKPLRRERVEISRVRRYMNDHYADDIRLDDLAALVAWSPFHFLRTFRAEVGLPPHAYLESIRIRRAQAHLRAGDSIAETAYATGFSSQSHFTTAFKRLIGVTPGQFRREVIT